MMREMFEAIGTGADEAKFVGDSLVDANLAVMIRMGSSGPALHGDGAGG